MAKRRRTKASPSEPRAGALARAARGALRHSHSPYSKIRVGAALLAADGQVFTGCNVENASYGLTLCAERVAIAKAVSEGVRRFRAIAIAASTKHALPPCGACRQSLLEFAPKLRVLLVGPRGVEREFGLDELLPEAFGPRDLR
jgi:cytidine deaminase